MGGRHFHPAGLESTGGSRLTLEPGVSEGEVIVLPRRNVVERPEDPARWATFLADLSGGSRAVLIGVAAAPAVLLGVTQPVAAEGATLATTGEAEALARHILFRDEVTVPAASWLPAHQPVLRIGSRGDAVIVLQERLSRLGYDPGPIDGVFHRTVRTALLEYQAEHSSAVRSTGLADRATWNALSVAQPKRPPAPTHTPGGLVLRDVYPPGAPETIALFREAAAYAGVPQSWASSAGLRELLLHESHGFVGKPNYSYGRRSSDPDRWREVQAELRAGIKASRSSASGLGQLLLSNVEAHYPSGRAGIGNAFEEAVGMLRYIQARHGTPDRAWHAYNDVHEGY